MKKPITAFSLFFLLLGFCGKTTAQEVDFNPTKIEIEEAASQEQTAFETGDCDKLIAFYDDSVSFYANGNQVPSKDMIGRFCKNIPRPFENKYNQIEMEVYALTTDSGYTVRTFRNQGEPSKIMEVVTKIWKKTDGKWKIVHFQSTVKKP